MSGPQSFLALCVLYPIFYYKYLPRQTLKFVQAKGSINVLNEGFQEQLKALNNNLTMCKQNITKHELHQVGYLQFVGWTQSFIQAKGPIINLHARGITLLPTYGLNM